MAGIKKKTQEKLREATGALKGAMSLLEAYEHDPEARESLRKELQNLVEIYKNKLVDIALAEIDTRTVQ